MAGYTGEYGDLASISTENLKKPDILAAYDAYMKPKFEAHGITVSRLLNELAGIAFSDIGDIIDFEGESPRMRRASQIPAMARKSIMSMKVKRYVEGGPDDAKEVEITEFKFWPKNDALTTLAKMLRMIGKDDNDANTLIDNSRHLHLHDHKHTNPEEARAALLTFLNSRK